MIYDAFKKFLLPFLIMLCSCVEKPDEEIIVQVKSITLSQTTMSMAVGEIIQLQVVIYPQNASDKTITWSSSDEAIATVDGNGNVNGNKAGDVIITAKSGDKTASCSVTVKPDGTPAGGLEGTGEEEMH